MTILDSSVFLSKRLPFVFYLCNEDADMRPASESPIPSEADSGGDNDEEPEKPVADESTASSVARKGPQLSKLRSNLVLP